MVRRMDIDGEMFRAVVLKKTMVSNPDYDWHKGWQQFDDSGERIPSQIPSETETYTDVYGPYARKSDASAQRTIRTTDGYGNQHIVGSHIERAVVTWEILDD